MSPCSWRSNFRDSPCLRPSQTSPASASWANFAFTRKEELPTPELTEEDEEWLEAPLVEEEEKEPYEVYTGEQTPPLQTRIEAIENDKHLSAWGKRSKIQEASNRAKSDDLGKIY